MKNYDKIDLVSNFVFFIVGIAVNYFELNKMKKDLEEIKNG